MIEAETQTIEVEVVTNTEVTSTGQVEIEPIDLSDLDITVAKKEYVITGDNIYVPMLYDDAPQWMKDLVNLAVDVSMETANASSLAQLTSILTEFATSYVPLNQYTQSILNLSNADSSIHSLITTLNSNFNDGLSEANSQIITLNYTKASKTEVVTQVIDTIASQLATPGSSLSSIVARLDQSIANETNARALSMEVLTASIEDINGGVEATAQAVNTLEASVTNINGILSTHTGQITNLQTQASTVDGKITTAKSDVTNSLNTIISNGDINVESKWGYNSNIAIGGIQYSSGFGLATNINSPGHGIPTGQSEFWIKADKLKMTTTGYNGTVYSPFSVNGTNGEISFNGKVTFSNVTNTSGTGSNLLYNSAPKIGSETKGWYVWTNSGMTVNLSAGLDIWKPTGGASVAADIGGNPSIGSVYDVGQSSRFPVIAGSRYEASAYISAHRSNSYVFLVFYDTAGNYAGESSGNVINYAGSSALVNWGRSSVFTTAPGNAATATLIIRSVVTGSNPYCFVANAFTGVAEANQTTPSNWSEGTSAGATYTSELSNDSGFTTLGAVASQGYVLPAGVANAINTNTTTVHGSKVTTGSIGAAQIAANSISADRLSSTNGNSTVWTGGGLVSANFNGNVNGNIGTPTAGFRLSSNASGTSTDPNIYGAYIMGGTMEGVSLNFGDMKIKSSTDSTKTGLSSYSTTSSVLVGSNYGTGHDARRVCSGSSSIIVHGSINYHFNNVAPNNAMNVTVALQYSTDSSSYTTLDSGQEYLYNESPYNFPRTTKIGTIYLRGMLTGESVPSTGYIGFRVVVTSSSNASYSEATYLVTLNNQ